MEHVDHILIVDDDREIRELVGNYLKKNGLRTTIVADGRQMRAFLEANTVDLIVLDIMMPGDDGLLLCRELRVGKHKATPVLMLTARNDETDRIIGLEMGADDYLTKPFSARELLARINAVLRRTRMLPPNLTVSESSRLIGFGQWQLDTSARHLLDDAGTVVALSGAEYRLLRVFLDHPQRVLSRDQLLNLTQGREADIFDRSIDLLVSRLRQRLGDDAREPEYIKTVRSEGLCVLAAGATGRGPSMKLAVPRPRSLAARLALILFAGLVLAYGLSFASQFYERYQTAKHMMLDSLEQDVAISVAMLDRLTPAEREAWLPRLERRTYRYRLDAGEPGQPLALADAPVAAHSIERALDGQYPLTLRTVADSRPHFQVLLRLRDGSPLTIDVTPAPVPLSGWLPLVLLVQLLLLLLCTGLAVRTAIGPLTRLVKAVEHLDPNRPAQPLAETGPREVAHAAAAFNAMQARIADYLKERMQLLAAISHDLQTPITRMKLRVEFMDASSDRDKLWNDLEEMQHLVREGVAYARSMHGSTETSCRVDLDAFLDSLVFDYQDSGKQVQLDGRTGAVIDTRPHALRRVLVNLVDNALKFAGAARLEVERRTDGGTRIQVLDNGPGIPAEELDEVLKPFYRVENSRNRDTGGTGLGLAIAQQLSLALGGRLTLANRAGGGCARIELDP